MTRAAPEGHPRRWPDPRIGVEIALMRAGDLQSGDLVRPQMYEFDRPTPWWPIEYVVPRGTKPEEVPEDLHAALPTIPQEMVLLQRRQLPAAWFQKDGTIGQNTATLDYQEGFVPLVRWVVPWWELYEVQRPFELYSQRIVDVELPDGEAEQDILDAVAERVVQQMRE